MRSLFTIANYIHMSRVGKQTGPIGILGIFLILGVIYIPYSHWNSIIEWMHTSKIMAPVMAINGDASNLSIFVALLITAFIVIVAIPFILVLLWLAAIVIIPIIDSPATFLSELIIKIFKIKPKNVEYRYVPKKK